MISPYLLRPLRSVEEAERDKARARVIERLERSRQPRSMIRRAGIELRALVGAWHFDRR